jgi:hypothetical protein
MTDKERERLGEVMARAFYDHDNSDPDCGDFESTSDMVQECYRERAAFVLAAAERAGFRIEGPK